MKNIMMLILSLAFFPGQAQETPQQTMENRARELHRVISLEDKAQWKEYIEANFTEAFLNKTPSRKMVVDGEERSSPSAPPAKTRAEKVEGKMGLMEMLHNDFGGSELVSLKYNNYNVTMVLASGNGLRGTFNIDYAKEKPYLINNMGIEATR